MLVKYVLSDGISQAFLPDLLCEYHFITSRSKGYFVIKAAVEMQNNLPFCD
jgi:hypothetical protein